MSTHLTKEDFTALIQKIDDQRDVLKLERDVVEGTMNRLFNGGDGVALTSMAHPIGKSVGGLRLNPRSMKTVEIEIPDHLVARRAKTKKRKYTKKSSYWKKKK